MLTHACSLTHSLTQVLNQSSPHTFNHLIPTHSLIFAHRSHSHISRTLCFINWPYKCDSRYTVPPPAHTVTSTQPIGQLIYQSVNQSINHAHLHKLPAHTHTHTHIHTQDEFDQPPAHTTWQCGLVMRRPILSVLISHMYCFPEIRDQTLYR